MPTLTLLHTNDLHAHFDAMTRLAALIQRERASAQAEERALLLLDAGDSSDSKAWESDVTGGRANYAMLEAMGYDAVTIGNSDLQWGLEPLTKLVASVHFPALAANLTGLSTPLPHLRPYTLFHIGELTVAVVGLTTEKYVPPDLALTDPVQALSAALPQLQAAGAHLVIVLSHLGFEADQRLATAVPEVRLILGGHTHTVLSQPFRLGETLIAQAGEHGNYLGRVDLEYANTAQTVTLKNGFLIRCDAATPPDPTLSGMLDLIRFEAEVVRKKKKNE